MKNRLRAVSRRARRANRPQQRIPSLHDPKFCAEGRRFFQMELRGCIELPTLPRRSPWAKDQSWYIIEDNF